MPTIRGVCLVGLVLTACAVNTAPVTPMRTEVAPPASGEVIRLLDRLLTLLATGPRQALLHGDLTARELRHIGFDGVSVADVAQALLAALREHEQRPHEGAATTALRRAAADYLAAHHEAIVRRTAGAASCLPSRR